MGSISDFLEGELLDHIFNGAAAAWTPPTTVYVGLSTADPLDDNSGIAEPVGNNYARVAVTFGAANARAITNSGTVTFPQASGSWGTVTHYAFFTLVSGGSMMAHGALAASKVIVSGNTPSFAASELDVEFKTLAVKANGHNISDYLANKILDFAFRNQAFSQPATYIGYATANLTDATTGATVTECADANGYARKLVNINGGSSPTWDLASSSIVDNTHNIDSGPPTGSWGLITAGFIADSGTHAAGNILFYDNNLIEQTPGNGDTVRIEAGAGDFSLS